MLAPERARPHPLSLEVSSKVPIDANTSTTLDALPVHRRRGGSGD